MPEAQRSALSTNGVPIRLTAERWLHITEEHSEMAGLYFDVLEAVQSPQAVFEGTFGELLAIREIEERKFVVVVYRESAPDDGFVITAFLTRRMRPLERRNKIWPR
jgi:hypothetical protein